MRSASIKLNIPKGWQMVTIEDVCENLDNLRKPVTKSNREPGDIPYYGATGIVDYVKDYIFDEPILLIGEDGADWSKYANTAYEVDGKSWVNNHAHVLRCAKINRKFLKEYLNYEDLNNFITGGTRGKLTKGVLSKISIALPPSLEQQKIAEILGAVDEEIKKTDEVITATEKLKRGLMQKLFTRGARFRRFTSKALNDVLDLVIDHRGLTPKKLGGEWSEEGIPAISAMNVKNGRIVKTESIRFVGDNLFKKWMPEGIRPGDVLLTSEAPLGEVYLVKNGDLYCLSQRLFALRPKKEILGGYLYYFFMSSMGQVRLLERATGSTAKGIRQTELRKVKVDFPDIKRQEEIFRILSLIDEKILVNQKLKEKLALLKKGLMQDLLSGKKRTICKMLG